MSIKGLNDGTVFADSKKFQDAEFSFRHGMRNVLTNQTVADAMIDADWLVRQQFNRGKALLKQGDIYKVYYEFSIGLHALQNATSPAHSGFQPWGGEDNEGPLSIAIHVAKETYNPSQNSKLQVLTNVYVDWFTNSDKPLTKENLFKGL